MQCCAPQASKRTASTSRLTPTPRLSVNIQSASTLGAGPNLNKGVVAGDFSWDFQKHRFSVGVAALDESAYKYVMVLHGISSRANAPSPN